MTRLQSLINLKNFMDEMAKTLPDMDWSVKIHEVNTDIDEEKKRIFNGKEEKYRN